MPREIQPQPRKPLFVFFPTLNTHMPFRPTPPLQEDWARVLSTTPFDAPDVQHSITETPQWTNMGASYADSVRYAFEVLASYLRHRPDEHFVLIVLGDHQPAANVSGEGASWMCPYTSSAIAPTCWLRWKPRDSCPAPCPANLRSAR